MYLSEERAKIFDGKTCLLLAKNIKISRRELVNYLRCTGRDVHENRELDHGNNTA